jgi:putative peptidoglycan lipid II flippase
VPETLIGTAIGTALLPTISELVAKKEYREFRSTVRRVASVLIALSIPSAVLLAAALAPFLEFAFGFDAASTTLLLWVTRAFLAGLLGHTLLELGSRIFFAQQNATIPMAAAGLNLVIFVVTGILLSGPLNAVGVGLADAIAFSSQAAFLFIVHKIWFNKKNSFSESELLTLQPTEDKRPVSNTIFRSLLGSLIGSALIFLIIRVSAGKLNELLIGIIAAASGMLVAAVFVIKEIKMLLRL